MTQLANNTKMMNRIFHKFLVFFIFGKYLVGVFCDLSVNDDEVNINIVDTTFTTAARNKPLVETGSKLKQLKNIIHEETIYIPERNYYPQLPSRITDDISMSVKDPSITKRMKNKFLHRVPESLVEITLENESWYSTEPSNFNVSTTEIHRNVLTNTKSVSGNETKCLKEFSCINCTAVRVCAPSPVTHQFEEISRFVCSDNAPYCDEITGTCVSSMKTAFKCARSASFICLKDGYFPHPSDCSKYFLCLNYKSYEFQCKSEYYYNFRTHSCDPYRYDKQCNMFNCKGHNGFKIPYSRDSSIYAYCVSNKPYVITQCDGKEKLNVTSQRCEPVCEHEGLIEDTTDCTAYYKCVKIGFFYTKTSQKCLYNQGFDPSSFQCVSLSLLPDCDPGKK